MRDMSRRLDVRWKDVLADQIRQGVELGVFVCDDAEGAAWRLSALLDGLAVQVMVHRNLTKKQLARGCGDAGPSSASTPTAALRAMADGRAPAATRGVDVGSGTRRRPTGDGRHDRSAGGTHVTPSSWARRTGR